MRRRSRKSRLDLIRLLGEVPQSGRPAGAGSMCYANSAVAARAAGRPSPPCSATTTRPWPCPCWSCTTGAGRMCPDLQGRGGRRRCASRPQAGRWPCWKAVDARGRFGPALPSPLDVVRTLKRTRAAEVAKLVERALGPGPKRHAGRESRWKCLRLAELLGAGKGEAKGRQGRFSLNHLRQVPQSFFGEGASRRPGAGPATSGDKLRYWLRQYRRPSAIIPRRVPRFPSSRRPTAAPSLASSLGPGTRRPLTPEAL